MSTVLFIDGGTTNTRFTLLQDGHIVAKAKQSVGAVTTRDASRNIKLENAVRENIARFEAGHSCKISAVLACGMITSNLGLKEIPHLKAPVTFEKLAANVEPHILMNISEDLPFYMVPGIKFNTDDSVLAEKDLMRGEETEIFGALTDEYRDKTIVFLHLGSHGKAILYRDLAIRNSITTMGGELLWIACHNTILQSAVSDFNDFELQPSYVKQGYEVCLKHGLTRSLYLGCVAKIAEARTPEEVTSFIYGAVTCCDLESFLPLINENPDFIFAYGRDSFVQALIICMETFHPEFQNEVRTINFLNSENLPIRGMNLIYNEISRQS